MRQAYNLNLEAVLSVLLRRQLSGTLSASLPKNKILKGSSQIEMLIDRGKLQACELRTEQEMLTGEESLRIIAQLGIIPWIFEPTQLDGPRLSQTSGQLPALHLGSSGVHQFSPLQEPMHTRVPRKIALLSTADLSRLPKSHFYVYARVDGKHTLAEIAQLLRTTPDRIESIIYDLQAWRLIALD